MDPSTGRPPIAAWRWSLFCFVIAAATGLLMRHGMLHGFPFGLVFGDVRHAHSHLMFFGWGTPILMLLLLHLTADKRSRLGSWIIGYALVVALLSFLPFLLSGYGTMTVFGRDLPLSMMTAGLSGLAWLSFAALYFARFRKAPSRPGTDHFTAAVLLLLVASAGVALLAVAGMSGWGGPIINALAIFYVETFAEGWFGIALLGISYRLLPRVVVTPASRAGLLLLALGLVVRSTADVLVKIGYPAFESLVLSGSAATGLGMLLSVAPLLVSLRRLRFSPWHVSLYLLAAKGLFDLLLAVPALASMSDAAGLRVFYLHAFLLGAFSIGLLSAARSLWGARAFRYPWLFVTAVLVMVGALLPISGAWPAAWSGRWAYDLAIWTSAGPLIAGVVALVLSFTPDSGQRPTQ